MTDGTILTGDDLRAFTKCSRFYSFGGAPVQYNPGHLLNKTAFELMTATAIRKPIKDYLAFICKAIPKSVSILGYKDKYLSGQIEKWQNESLRYLPAVFEILSPEIFFPVTGPIPWRVVLDSTPVETQAHGIYRTSRNQTLHMILFTPFHTAQDQLNDPVVNLLLHTSKELIKDTPHRPQAQVHIFGQDHIGNLTYNSIESSSADDSYSTMLTSIVQGIKSGYNYPTLPCPHAGCPFKQQCFPRKY